MFVSLFVSLAKLNGYLIKSNKHSINLLKFDQKNKRLHNYSIMKGENIKQVLADHKLQLKDVAEKMGTSLSNLSAGLAKSDIRTGLLERISEASGVPIAVFYGEDYAVVQTVTGDNNTQVSGTGNTVASDGAFIEYIRVKDEQLTMAMKQTSKAQEQMDEVLKLFRKPADRVEEGDQ